ncbi:uncharacterized protein LOC111137135 [Crassostrea virginica]
MFALIIIQILVASRTEIHFIGPGDASKHSAFPLISILLGLCASIGSLATVVILLYIRERKRETTRDTIQTAATNMEENRSGMCEIEDYDNIRESHMDFTVEKHIGIE